MAVSTLRNHYINDAARILASSLPDRKKDDVTASALDTLAFLRPSDPVLLQEADQNIGFSPVKRISDDTMPAGEYPAARLLIRASFAALPLLSKDFTTNLVQPGHTLTKPQKLRLQCVAAILTTSTPSWFRGLAATERDPAVQKSLLYCSELVSVNPPARPGAPPPPPSANFAHGRGILTDFWEADVIDEDIDTDDLDQINASKYMIHWNAAAGLADDHKFGVDPPLPPWPNSQASGTMIASHDVERTMALLSYTICLRLNTDPNIKSKQDHPLFAEDAVVGAITVLGSLRSTTLAPYVIWQRLRDTSLKLHLENDTSLISQASLTALGQIDVPAAKLLIARIGYESSPEQRQAAAYALGKVLGSYATPYLDGDISMEQANMAGETNQSYKPEFQDKITHLKNVRALGTEKGWFMGNLYGYGNSYAYTHNN